jgi:hypothetical protein
MSASHIAEDPKRDDTVEEALTDGVLELILESAPERRRELYELWERYSPVFERASDQKGFRLEGGPFGLILFTMRTMGQIWILGFAAWRAFEAYCPYGLLFSGEIMSQRMAKDWDLVWAEEHLKAGLNKARELRNEENLHDFKWPAEIPIPGLRQPKTTQEQAVVDLIRIATTFVFLHEIRHAMLTQDHDGYDSAVDEEYECDRYAWTFVLQNVTHYCAETRQDYKGVLSKRLMGLMLGLFLILEITPKDKRQGSAVHPPPAERFRRLVQSQDPTVKDYVWIYGLCLLLGILRSEQRLPPATRSTTPRQTFDKLVSLL